jgi:uncharacterized protein YjbI with pentapeptide repeats
MGLREWVGSLAGDGGSEDDEPRGASPRAGGPAEPALAPTGPNLAQLSQVAWRSRFLWVSAELVPHSGERIRLDIRQSGPPSAWGSATQRGTSRSYRGARSFADALAGVVTDVHRLGRLDVDSVTCRSEDSPLRGTRLKDLCVAALCEAFGEPVPSSEDLDNKRKARRAAAREKGNQSRALRKELLALLAEGEDGVAQWNKRRTEAASIAPLKKADLAGKDLTGVRLVDVPEGRFIGATLSEADLSEATFRRADFGKATLTNARLCKADLRDASFAGADLQNADLSGARVQGADFSGARLNGSRWKGTQFDEKTKWPKGFSLPETLRWTGKGPDPAALAAIATHKKKEGPIDLAAFMKRLEKAVDKPRMQKALSMLKKDRFQLFVETSGTQLSGVVKSQSDPDLVYSAVLSASGAFSCCTQNLNVCGGLRGALCKHLLVLIIGLAQSAQMEADTLDDWVQRSTLHQPALQRDVQSAILLRYKGVEAGEIDWRPTETVPEDYYAL